MSKHKPIVTPPCRICRQPAIDTTAVLCRTCLDQLERALGDVAALTARPTSSALDYRPSLADDLDVVIAGDQRIPSAGNGPAVTSETPAGRADRLGSELRNAIVTWTRITLEDAPCRPHNDTTATLAGWLLHHTRKLIHHEAADDMHRDIVGVVERIRRAIDSPPDREFVGHCWHDENACTLALYALPGDPTVTCVGCGEQYPIGDVRDRMRDLAVDELETAAQIARIFSTSATPVTPERIRKWAERGRLFRHDPHPDDPWQHPRYRIGDVEELLDREQERHADRLTSA